MSERNEKILWCLAFLLFAAALIGSIIKGIS